MPDDHAPPPVPGSVGPEPLPDSYQFPPALVEEWLAMPPDVRISVDLRRGDLDQFYASINRCIEAQYGFQDCIVDYTNGRLDLANAKLRASQRRLIEAQNALRQFMTSVMASATRPSR